MRFTYEEIKKELADNWERFEGLDEFGAGDIITEYADSFIPVYNNEIIKDWAEMPSEFDDSWQEELGCDWNASDRGIVALMAFDLFGYYREQTINAWNELLTEKEAEND